jgi:hypothetical protein
MWGDISTCAEIDVLVTIQIPEAVRVDVQEHKPAVSVWLCSERRHPAEPIESGHPTARNREGIEESHRRSLYQHQKLSIKKHFSPPI